MMISAPVRPRSSTVSNIKNTAVVALAAAAALPKTAAHSWIEEYQVVGTNGSYIGDRGYSRGYMARTDEGYNGFSMDWLVPSVNTRINSTDLLCHPSQRISNYTNTAYPKLKVQPGGYVAMKYLENGHVTLPWNQLGKPAGAGTVFVYGTTQPSDTEKIADVLQWNINGTGGDGRGFLMTAQNFDDGRCHQINCGNISIARQIAFPDHQINQNTSTLEQWCETDLKIPSSQPAGTLTTYWVWQWPTEANADCTYPEGKDEYYTTCADFDIVDKTEAELAALPATHTLAQENPQSTAPRDYTNRVALTASPPVIMIQNGTQTVGPVSSASSAFLAACSASGNAKVAAVSAPASCDAVSVFTGDLYSSAVKALQADATTGLANAVRVQANVAAPTGGIIAAVAGPIPSAASAAVPEPLSTSISVPASTAAVVAAAAASSPSPSPSSSSSSSSSASATTATNSSLANLPSFKTLLTISDASASASASAPVLDAALSVSAAATTIESAFVTVTVTTTVERSAASDAAATATGAAGKGRRHARAFFGV